ncbi:MAG: hypothetical protein OEY01_09980 [Desulfobulbaceae bacterium]|nr:hypothetical protein [Desulfobulbaceae bacterium]HIJ79301.1 hypothetical protein [Deltaproteobacteria bacterium]
MEYFGSVVNKTVVVLVLFVCTGCVGSSLNFPPKSDLADTFRYRAIQHEKDDELQQAMVNWQVVDTLIPENKEADGQIRRLDRLAREKSLHHFKDAMTLHKKGEVGPAQRQLLIALRYDPENSFALAALRKDNKIHEHPVAEGDSLKNLALRYYQNKDYVFLIAYFNDIQDSALPLVPGTVLHFPSLPVEASRKPSVDPVQLLDRAQKSFQAKTYEQTISLAKEVLTYDYTISEAAQLLNRSYLEFALHQLQAKDYDGAQASLENVEDNFPGLHALEDEIRATRQRDAETHYRLGVKFYVNENLQNAINEWQETLRIYPEHDGALLNINKANSILEKLKAVH